MMDVYQTCPVFEDDAYRIRFLEDSDCSDLLLVYSDTKAVPFFNSDNCNGDDFHYMTLARMQRVIDYWHWEYEKRGYVRFTIVDKRNAAAIGTIELFHREAEDKFNHHIVLRLDLRSDYETTEDIRRILSLILEPSFALFHGEHMITKAIPAATERRKALAKLGFVPAQEQLIGKDGTVYGDYFILSKTD